VGRGACAEPGARRSTAARIAIAIAAFALFTGLLALGTWQLHRRTWKLALIARVERRVHALPVAPPAPPDWPQVSAERDEYLRVRIGGAWLRSRETRVHAATELGTGYWVMTPLKTADGTVVLVNRGFVQPGWREGAAATGDADDGPVTVTGLLRLSEPGGSLLRHNDPAAERWYSRDVAAIAAARGLTGVAPYFIDAEAPPPADRAAQGGADEPVAGLTVINFYNNHLVYAITWYALALMVAAAAWRVARSERLQDGDATERRTS
jgi:surfeit locus 1 family protein